MWTRVKSCVNSRIAIDRASLEDERQRLFELSSDLLAVIALDGKIVDVNPAWRRILGYTEDELIGQSALDLVHPEDRTRTIAVGATLLTGDGTLEYSNRFLCKDGRNVDLEWHAVRAPDYETFYASARDVTKRNELETRLHRSQRLEAIGQLAGGVAHDFNNILGIILNYSELLAGSVSGEERNDVEQIRLAAERGVKLSRQLLTFSRRDTKHPKPLSLNVVIEESCTFLEQSLGENLVLERILDPDLHGVSLDPSQLDQILLNLAINARDAMSGPGHLRITTSNVRPKDVPPGLSPENSYVLLEVADDGVGMDPDTMDHIFEPFFTTRLHEGGTGLGLATVYGIVKDAEGAVQVDSAPGIGTTFRIYFPRADDRAAEPTEDIEGHPVSRGWPHGR